MSHPHTQSNPTQSDTQLQDVRLGRRLKDTPVAIVGMASLFANSKYLDEFWDLIVDKIDAITQVPESHWDPKAYFDKDPAAADKVYCQHGGFLPEMEFNPLDFGLPPNILEQTDTAQLLALLVARDLMIDAGIEDEASYDRDRVGITLGIGGGQKISQAMNARLQYPVLKKIFKSSGINDDDCDMLIRKFQDQYIPWQENAFPGSLGNVIAGRIANRFNLGGMNCVVDAACAGSLAAMRMALGELLDGRSDMMLTGGVCTDNSPYMYMSFSKTPAFTQDNKISPFDADSKGMMIGEGIGMLALKRLEDAERDGDRIYAVIKGIGASSDGRFKSIYAPRPEGQAKALQRAYDDAGFPPHTVGLIEAHGTGTAAGDIAEFNGLSSVFSLDEQGNPTNSCQHIALGSVKSQVGHTKSTAGTAGVIKAALALHHKVLPPTINVSTPNPKMALESSPFYLSTQTRPWLTKPDGSPRRAGISSFGFGGTNFHIVLEEYQQEHQTPYRLRQTARPLLLSESNVDALKHTLKQTLQLIASGDADFDTLSADFALKPCPQQAPRLGLVAANLTELKSALHQADEMLSKSASSAWQLPSGVSFRPASLDGKLAVLFTGQGNQYLHMGKELACLYPEMRTWLQEFDHAFNDKGLKPLSDVLHPFEVFNEQAKTAQQMALTDTRYAQSAIGALCAGHYQLLTKAGVKPDMLAGHSYGELTALWAAGVLDAQTLTQLSLARGEAMALAAEQEPKGSMLAAVLAQEEDEDRLDAVLKYHSDVTVANRNSPSQLVLAGEQQALTLVAAALKKQGIKTIPLKVAGAFHTPMMQLASDSFNAAIDKQQLQTPTIEVWSNQTGQPYNGDIAPQLKQHMLSQVDYVSQIKEMIASGGRIFVELGPKGTQARLVQDIAARYFPELAEQLLVLSCNPTEVKKGAADNSDTQLKQALVALAVAGQPLTNPDTWAITHKHHEVTPSPMNIRLSGAHYISPATRDKAQQSLAQGQITPVVKTVEKVIEKIVEKPQSSQASKMPQTTDTQASAELSQLFSAQSDAAKVHQAFLDIPRQYNETFNQLMQAQVQLASQGHAVPDSLLRSIELFHQHQAETLKVHQAYLAQISGGQTSGLQDMATQSISTQAMAPQTQATQVSAPPQTVMTQPQLSPQHQAVEPQAARAQTAPIYGASSQDAPASPITPEQPNTGALDIATSLLAVVADKTGYPAEMLELSMDMEADLGIDSIKRVEILGAVQEALPQLPPLSPDVLAECRTLAQIQEEVQKALPSQPVAQVQHEMTTDIQSVLLSVVADKTGYPAEMLELSMDMEADLGIDSIKRVEILGAVQEALPQLPPLSPDILAECRTLQQVQDEIYTALPSQPALQPTSQPELQTKVTDDLQSVLLEVVADKTGYPAEMLELSMDMEADLGIDSIKRVEILGAVQEALPQLPTLSPEAMAECRTLAQILTLLASSGAATETAALIQEAGGQETGKPATSAHDAESHQSPDVISVLLDVVADKTGYPAEMLDLSMDMEADLGIDSIKRVEILGAVQEALPQLPALSPEALAECRTLAEITVQLVRANDQPEPVSPIITKTDADKEKAEVEPTAAITELPPFSGVTLSPAAPQGDALTLAKGSKVLLLDDGQHAGIVAEKLKAKALHPIVLSLGAGAVLASDIEHHTLSDAELDSKQLQQALTKVLDAVTHADLLSGELSAVILLSSPLQSQQQQKLQLMAALMLAKLTSSRLHNADQALFASVTRIDGGFGYIPGAEGEPTSWEYIQASALHGLTKTLSHEWPKVTCKALDIAPQLDPKQYAALLIDEVLHNCANTEIGLNGSDRTTPVATADTVTGVITQPPLQFDQGDTILVSGGAKGVTLDCALELARETGSHFVLLGRSELPASLPAWTQGIAKEGLKSALLAHVKQTGEKLTPKQLDARLQPMISAIDIQSALNRFTELGASAEYIALDITHAREVADTLSPLAAIRPFSGLIHGAGVLADKRIEEKELQQFSAVYDTKVEGLSNLLSALAPESLKFISLFSSAAGFYGNAGQSDYAMANEVLNKQASALKQRYPQLKITSFNWGPWDGGMVNAGLKAMFEQRGVYVIPRAAGARLFSQQVRETGLLHCLIGSDMQGNTSAKLTSATLTSEGDRVTGGPTSVKKPEAQQQDWSLALRQHTFLREHQILGNPVLPTACALSLMLDASQESAQPDSQWLTLNGYQLLKGVVFDDREEVQLKLITDKQSLLISADAKPAYKANFQPATAPSASATAIPSRLKLEYKEQGRTGSECYQSGPLFHDKGLQLIQRFAIKESQLLAMVTMPATQGEYGLFSGKASRISALDAILQGALVLARDLSEQDSLPVAISQLTVHAQLDQFNEGLLWLHNATVIGHSFQCDASLLADTGEVLAQAKGIKLTLSDTDLNPRRAAATAHKPLLAKEQAHEEQINAAETLT